jgi:hypothetical protein
MPLLVMSLLIITTYNSFSYNSFTYNDFVSIIVVAFSSYLNNGPNKLECLSLASLSSLV